jgi:PAS domain S-box-containing protein
MRAGASEEPSEGTRLFEFLEKQAGRILRTWEERVRSIPAAGHLAQPALRDHVPELLARMAEVVHGAPEGGEVSLGDLPDLHAVDRLSAGFDVRAVVRELTVLRQVTLELWQSEAGGDPVERLAEVQRFDAVLDDVITVSLERYAAARQHALLALDRASAAALATAELEPLLASLLRILLEVTPAHAGAFLLASGDELVVRAAEGLWAEALAGARLRGDEGVAGRAAASRAPVDAIDPDDATPLGAALRGTPLRAVYAVPLVAGGDLLGVLCVASASPQAFSAEDAWVIRAVAERTTAVILQADLRARERAAEARTRERERDVARLFTVSQDLLSIVGTDGYPKRVNPAYSRVLGRTEAELLSRPFLDLVHPDDRAAVEAKARDAAAGRPVENFEARLVDGNGHVRWVSFSAAGEPGAEDFAVVGRDITDDRRRAAFERQLIGIVSHDLRNPLSTILTSVAALQRRADELDDRTIRALARIRSACDRSATLISDLLDFTKARMAGGIPIEPEPIDLHVVARDAAEEVHSAFPDRALRYERSGAADGLWDPQRVTQVVSNLVSNAFKYGAPGTPVVVRTTGGDRWVRLEVQNQGTPIDPELFPHMFEPLRQGQRAGPGGERGIGLGLYIVDHIVRAHGGTIDVRSTAAEGTTFLVRLPREPPALVERATRT